MKRYKFDSYEDEGPLCEKLSFTSAEEYKMLRTKIDLVLPAEIQSGTTEAKPHFCRTIGITSALRGEGKSTTAMNLSWSFAEAGCRVCLIEADMRLPNIGRRLELNEKPGLSNILTGKIRINDAIQSYEVNGKNGIKVITAGDIPPLPSELLESQNMGMLLKSLSDVFDYIFVDLPPVNIVTDALSLTKQKHLDGILLVARERVGTKKALRQAVEQFDMTDTKILGIVYNASKSAEGSYRRYRRHHYYKYSRYYRGDYREYRQK